MIETTQTVPLTIVEGGTSRIAGLRINLDSVLYLYHQGESVEQIHEAFPSLLLADIHTVIGYYLNHRAEVDEYLQRQAVKAAELRRRIESDPTYQARSAALREHIKEREAALQKSSAE